MVTEVRTTLNLPADLAELVDDYWHNQRLSSRNEAIRELLVYALGEITEPAASRIHRQAAKEKRR